jgi:hypothetical protein
MEPYILRSILAMSLMLAATLPVHAETWLTPEAFEAHVSGKMIRVLNLDGSPFGSEFFSPDRKVFWRFSGEEDCLIGSWRPRKGAICYTYADGPENCLRYRLEQDRLVGEDANEGGPLGDPVVLIVTQDAPPACSGS